MSGLSLLGLSLLRLVSLDRGRDLDLPREYDLDLGTDSSRAPRRRDGWRPLGSSKTGDARLLDLRRGADWLRKVGGCPCIGPGATVGGGGIMIMSCGGPWNVDGGGGIPDGGGCMGGTNDPGGCIGGTNDPGAYDRVWGAEGGIHDTGADDKGGGMMKLSDDERKAG